MCLSSIIFLASYFSTFPLEVKETISFLSIKVETRLSNVLTKDESIMAMSIVAPEISQFSSIRDEVETGVLKVMYVQKGWGNFSIGPFQMKPSFAEALERENSDLFNQPKKNGRRDRADRVKRLSSLEGQIEYLLLFIKTVRKKTANLSFVNNEEKLLYWAMLYNAGLYLSHKNLNYYLSRKQFPRYSEQFNYAQICLEFYRFLRNQQWAETISKK